MSATAFQRMRREAVKKRNSKYSRDRKRAVKNDS